MNLKGQLHQYLNDLLLADLALGVLLVVIRCFWSDSFAILDSPNVQVRPVFMDAEHGMMLATMTALCLRTVYSGAVPL